MTNQIHHSYLLRLWRDHTGAPWRATVLSVARPTEQRHFASVDALLAFLIETTDSVMLSTQARTHPAEWDCEDCTPDGADWTATDPYPAHVQIASEPAAIERRAVPGGRAGGDLMIGMATTTRVSKPVRLLGIFAHPDDESFCAGGTFAKYAAAGSEIMVVSATRGEAGQIRDAAAATRRTLGAAREAELQEACARIGVQEAVCLDYGDGKLQSVSRELLVGQFVEIIRSFRPDIVLTFGEDGAYGHPDHVAVSIATTEACELAGRPEYCPHHIAEGLKPHAPSRLYYSHFPRSETLLMNELVTWLMGLQTKFRGTPDFANGLLLFSQESSTLRFNSDYIDVSWYPPGFSIVEQGEPAVSLYLVLSGHADVLREDHDGTLRCIDRLHPGDFFGELGIAAGAPRMAHVVARDSVTCLIFSPGEPTPFAGRGGDAGFAVTEAGQQARNEAEGATTCVDVADYVGQKIAAIASHRTQYPLQPDIFPMGMLRQLFGREYFVRGLPRHVQEHEL